MLADKIVSVFPREVKSGYWRITETKHVAGKLAEYYTRNLSELKRVSLIPARKKRKIDASSDESMYLFIKIHYIHFNKDLWSYFCKLNFNLQLLRTIGF